VLALLMLSCGTATTSAVPTVRQVSSSQPVIGQDSLSPLPPGTTVGMSITTILSELQQNPRFARYVANPASLTVLLGQYTYSWLVGETHSVPAYVISGEIGGCSRIGFPPEIPPGSSARVTVPTPTSHHCIATLVVDANTGNVLIGQEKGIPG